MEQIQPHRDSSQQITKKAIKRKLQELGYESQKIRENYLIKDQITKQ